MEKEIGLKEHDDSDGSLKPQTTPWTMVWSITSIFLELVHSDVQEDKISNADHSVSE